MAGDNNGRNLYVAIPCRAMDFSVVPRRAEAWTCLSAHNTYGPLMVSNVGDCAGVRAGPAPDYNARAMDQLEICGLGGNLFHRGGCRGAVAVRRLLDFPGRAQSIFWNHLLRVQRFSKPALRALYVRA